jgi:NADPH-dependent glutamate synthase beta subunit-like oxidoreductase
MNKPFAITLEVGSSLLNKTGSWRTEKPVYLDRLPPCNYACPAGENIQEWLFHAEEGNYEAAWRTIMRDNPMPSVMGRACYHPCESKCNRKDVDEAVGIHAVERFLGDQATKHGWTIEPGAPTGKHVMVIGAGPGGLSAAYHLRRLGHDVTVYDTGDKPGGMLRYGIPKYRLPREKLNADIGRIEEMGVNFRMGTRVDDVAGTMKAEGYDACFMAVGAHKARMIDIPGDTSVPVLDGVSVLRNVEDDAATGLRGRVVVYGGGNTAMDVARSAIRLGARDVTVVVRGLRERMAAHAFEIEESLLEGVTIRPLRSIIRIEDGALVLEENVASEQGTQATGNTEKLEADVLVLAIGQNPDLTLVEGQDGVRVEDGVVQLAQDMQIGIPGVFAGGDMVPSERTMTTAIGHGKKAARHIDAWLRGEIWQPAPKHEIVGFDMLNTWYYSDADRTTQPALEVIRRQSGFAEVLGDLDEGNALFEARRCMSCGNCFECDNCYGVCPDNAITKLGPGKRFEFKYDYCKGCGLCAAECPCGAIRMEAEAI